MEPAHPASSATTFDAVRVLRTVSLVVALYAVYWLIFEPSMQAYHHDLTLSENAVRFIRWTASDHTVNWMTILCAGTPYFIISHYFPAEETHQMLAGAATPRHFYYILLKGSGCGLLVLSAMSLVFVSVDISADNQSEPMSSQMQHDIIESFVLRVAGIIAGILLLKYAVRLSTRCARLHA